MSPVSIATLASILLCGCASGVLTRQLATEQQPVWALVDQGAGAERQREVALALSQCTALLDLHLPRRPGTLQVFTYPTRDAFVAGLQTKLGFTRPQAEYFRKSASPRPIDGQLLVPPDQTPVNICHELVHHYMEANVPRDKLLRAKWFDEGVATLLADQAMQPESIVMRASLLRRLSAEGYLPLDSMQTEDDWHALHRDPRLRTRSYLQAELLVDRLLRSCGSKDLSAILSRASSLELAQAVEKVCTLNLASFHADWIASEQDWMKPVLFDSAESFLPRANPAEVGLAEEPLHKILQGAIQSRSDTLLIVKDGRVVVDRAFFGERGPIETMSVTKSIVSLAIGLLLSDGVIESVDTPVSTWLEAFGTPEKKAITLRHILTHTSGLQHFQGAGKMNAQTDRNRFAMEREVVDEPGRKFSYNNEAVQLLSAIIQKAAKEPLDTYLSRRLFKPLGIDRFRWVKDQVGNVQTFFGLALNSSDLAKIGLLLLNQGRYGDQQILPAAWIRDSISSQTSAFDRMGFLWWLRRHRPSSQGTAPGDIYACYADGWQGQMLYVIPDKRIVVVRQRIPLDFTPEENERFGFFDLRDLIDGLASS